MKIVDTYNNVDLLDYLRGIAHNFNFSPVVSYGSCSF